MKLNEAFPSNFLKATDLGERPVTVVIESAEAEEIGQGRDKGRKLVLSFVGKTKKLVCNKTNATTIGKLYGDETDNWIGKPITLASREVEFQGEMVWAIRVSLQKPASPAAPAAHKPAAKPEPSDNDGGNPPEPDPFA